MQLRGGLDGIEVVIHCLYESPIMLGFGRVRFRLDTIQRLVELHQRPLGLGEAVRGVVNLAAIMARDQEIAHDLRVVFLENIPYCEEVTQGF